MTESEKKTTPAQREQAKRNRDAAQRQRDLLHALLKAKQEHLDARLANYGPGDDFEYTHAFQKDDKFWDSCKEIDKTKGILELIEIEGQLFQLEERIKVYTEILEERG